MSGGSIQTIEDNLLGDKNSLRDRVQVVEGRFTVVSKSVEYMRLVFGLGFYHYVFEIQFPFM